MRSRGCLASLLIGIGVGMAPPVARADTTAQFEVTATIASGCLVDGLGSSGDAGQIGLLNFDTASTFASGVRTATTTANQAMRLRCTPGTGLTMSIDGGTHSATGQRNLQRGPATTARIPYALCRDAACTQPIGIGTGVPVAVTSANTEDVRLPIYGSLTLGGARPAGVYTDTLTITLTW